MLIFPIRALKHPKGRSLKKFINMYYVDFGMRRKKLSVRSFDYAVTVDVETIYGFNRL